MLYVSQDYELDEETVRLLREADGWMYFNLYSEAEQALIQVTPDEMKKSPVLEAFVTIALYQRRWEDAMDICLRSARFFPDELSFYVQFAFALRQHENAKVEEVLKILPEKVRESGLLHYNLACYEALLGDVEVSKVLLLKAIQLDKTLKKYSRRDPHLEKIH